MVFVDWVNLKGSVLALWWFSRNLSVLALGQHPFPLELKSSLKPSRALGVNPNHYKYYPFILPKIFDSNRVRHISSIGRGHFLAAFSEQKLIARENWNFSKIHKIMMEWGKFFATARTISIYHFELIFKMRFKKSIKGELFPCNFK